MHRRLSPLIPYMAVAVGLYGLGSAWLAIFAYHAGMLLVVLLGRSARGGHGVKGGVRGWWYASVVVYALGGIALYVLWPFILPAGSNVALRLGSLGVTRQIWPYFAVYFCCANSLIEELFWRGHLRDDSRRVTVNDFAFAGYHALVLVAFTGLIWAVPVFLACAFAAWLWRMMRASTGSLVMPLITHFVADLGIVAAVHLRLFV